MQGITLAIAIFSTVIIFFTKPKYWLIIYMISLAYYPNYLTIKLGTLDFNVTRILTIIMIVILFFKKEYLIKYKFIFLDKLVIIVIISQFFALFFTTPFSVVMENRFGSFLDTVLPYFIVRLTVFDWKSYVAILKGILFMMAPIVVVGVYQCITGHNPMSFLEKYSAWGKTTEARQEPRHGFYRAYVTFPMSIMYGLFFAMLGPGCVGLIKIIKKKNKPILYVGIIFTVLGAMSSMSSGPWMAASFSLAFILFYKYRKNWKTVLWLFVFGCLVVEVISNRHFYDVLTRFTFSSSTAWYRTRLFEVAFFEGGMSDHWLFGYGQIQDPGWGLKIDSRDFTDMVNHYLLILARYGLVGFIPFMFMIIESIKMLIKSFKASIYEQERWLIWCFAGCMFGLLSALNTVSLFGQPAIMLYLLFGFTGSFYCITLNNKKLKSNLNQLGDYNVK